MDLVKLFDMVWPVLVTIAVIAVVAPKVPEWIWRVLVIAPGALVIMAGLLVAFAAITDGGDARVNGAFLLKVIVAAGWSFWWGAIYRPRRQSAA